MRALILYPMNALVEDQMVRLRRALDGPAARAWFEPHRPGHRFYFGRYTGQTPGTGDPATESAVELLRDQLREAAAASARAISARGRRPGEEPGRHRCTCRASTARRCAAAGTCRTPRPDLLITNYSMLNILLAATSETAICSMHRGVARREPRASSRS